ncbi:MAG TPA: PadR family transcriptional regulator [Acidimicrobiales bacterium]|nr:PadR family transcriptional regulator [Acidimicrobiales bacterium]
MAAVLEMAVLGLLKDQELHGYELKKRLAETFGPLSRVSFGSLYPALRRLARAGAVEVVEGEQPRRLGSPTTGSLAGELAAFRARRTLSPRAEDRRARKVYRITSEGEALFARLLAESDGPDDDRAFNMRLAFARHMAAEERLGLLERRRAALVERLSRARSAVKAGKERWDSYGRALAEHSTESTEHDISWIDRLIEAERAGGPDAPHQLQGSGT